MKRRWSTVRLLPHRLAVAAAGTLAAAAALLVEYDHGLGKVVLCSIDYRVATRPAGALWRRLLANMGGKLRAAREGICRAFDDEGVLVKGVGPHRYRADRLSATLSLRQSPAEEGLEPFSR
ncbi:MAG: hypothetical protein JXB62_13760 [Pirellulales bacterium]|nr:hypothetical protein [Pirellulales bacterium]